MPRKQKDLGSYPKKYFEIVEQISRGEQVEVMRMTDRKMAIATSHDFNRFKQVMARERHPLFEHAIDIVVRVTNLAGPGMLGEFVLEFVPRGLAILADELRGSRRGIPSPLREELEVPGLVEPPPPTALQKFIEHAGNTKVGPSPGDEDLMKYLGNPKLQDADKTLREVAQASREPRRLIDPIICPHRERDIYGICFDCGEPEKESK